MANTLNVWKVTPFCEMFSCPLSTLGCNTEGRPFPIDIMEWFELSALNQFRGSNKGFHPKKHTEYVPFASWRISTLWPESRHLPVQGKLEVCAVKVLVRRTPGPCGSWDLGWGNHHFQGREEDQAQDSPSPQHSPGQTACLKCFPAGTPSFSLRRRR